MLDLHGLTCEKNKKQDGPITAACDHESPFLQNRHLLATPRHRPRLSGFSSRNPPGNARLKEDGTRSLKSCVASKSALRDHYEIESPQRPVFVIPPALRDKVPSARNQTVFSMSLRERRCRLRLILEPTLAAVFVRQAIPVLLTFSMTPNKGGIPAL